MTTEPKIRFREIFDDPKYRNVSPAVKDLIREVVGFSAYVLHELTAEQTQQIIEKYTAGPAATVTTIEKIVIETLHKPEATNLLRDLVDSRLGEGGNIELCEAESDKMREFHSSNDIRLLIMQNLEDIKENDLFNQQPFRLIVLSEYLRRRTTLKPGDTMHRWCRQINSALAKWYGTPCPFERVDNTRGYYMLCK
jgi:hypothetical protein